MRLGLSSLGRMESHVMATLQAVRRALRSLSAKHPMTNTCPPQLEAPVDFESGRMRLLENTDRLFGVASGKRSVRIMVTMPTEAARNYELIRDLLAAGMDVMRINCAHDSETEWLQMVKSLRRAEHEVQRRCRIYADLAGPKLRTGPTSSAGRVHKVRPIRDARGTVDVPVRVWLTPADSPRESSDYIPVTGDLLRHLKIG